MVHDRRRSPLLPSLAACLSLAVVVSPGCGEAVPPPDESARPQKIETPKAVQAAAKKAGRPIPKSIKDRS